MDKPVRTGLIAFVLVVAAYIAFAAVPFLTKERDMPSSITSPPALERISLVPIRPRGRACMTGITADRYAHEARFRAGNFGKPGPALTVTFSGGLTATAHVPAGWPDNATLRVPVPSPGRDAATQVCVRDDGRVPVALYAASDRSQSRALAVVDGNPTLASPQFGFWEARRVSLADRISPTVDRIATFRGPLSHAWIVWIVLVLFVLGVPLTLAWLVRRAASE